MAVQVKSITLWRREAEHRPGALAETLSPLAGANVDLQLLMGYRDPSDPGRAVLELYPIAGKKAAAAAGQAGLSPSAIPTLLVTGDNQPGLGHTITRTLAGAGININFLVAQVIGRRYSAVFGFQTPEDAKKAAGLIKRSRPARR